MKRLAIIMAVLICGAVLLPQATAMADDGAAQQTSHVIINEVKLGGNGDPKEYITLFNSGGGDVSLNGWKILYAKPSNTVDCQSSSWNVPNSQITLLAGTLGTDQLSSPIIRSLTDNAAGSLQLIDANGVVQDLVGWGPTAPCSRTSSAQIPESGKSIQRYLGCADSFPVDTGNNSVDFTKGITPNPTGLSDQYATACQPQTQQVQDGTTTTPPASDPTTCEGVVISELLPNPSGPDTAQEFIELYNPTTRIISLEGCVLQTSANSKTYTLTNVSLAPGAYDALYDSQTGLTLPNTAGGTAWLLSPTNELQAITYPSNLGDDMAWAQFAGNWQATYDPTPNAPNVLQSIQPCPAGQYRNADTGHCDTLVTAQTLVPCKPNQFRSTDTGRCRTMFETTNPAPCPAGKTRNPETNRCHSAPADPTLTPCKPGQERNPETNRCKSAATTTSPKPCQAGWTRNPQTNRCHKTAILGDTTKTTDVKAPQITHNWRWYAALAVIIAALGYAAHEWRQEVRFFTTSIKTKLKL